MVLWLRRRGLLSWASDRAFFAELASTGKNKLNELGPNSSDRGGGQKTQLQSAVVRRNPLGPTMTEQLCSTPTLTNGVNSGEAINSTTVFTVAMGDEDRNDDPETKIENEAPIPDFDYSEASIIDARSIVVDEDGMRVDGEPAPVLGFDYSDDATDNEGEAIVVDEKQKGPDLPELADMLRYKMQVAPHNTAENTDIVVADEVAAQPPPLVEIQGVVVPRAQLAEEEYERFRMEVEEQRRIQQKRIRLGLFFTIPIIVVGVVTTGIFCGTGKCSRTLPLPALSPTLSPTLRNDTFSDQEIEERANLFTAIVNSITFSPSPISYPGGSAEERALAWLIEEDLFFLDLYNISTLFFAHRYALAVIYFQLGPGSLDGTWLSPQRVCDWTGVECRWCSVFNCTDALSYEDWIHSLELGNRGLAGKMPDDVALIGSLAGFDLSNNILSGTIPSSIGTLKLLESLELPRNDVSEIPSELAELPFLSVLDLSKNTRLGSSFIRSAPQLAALPPFLLRMTSLTHLDLSSCNLFGIIPSQLMALSNLRLLLLQDNSIEGPIPNELGTLSELQFIFLSHNRLTGSLPSGLSDLTKLIAVDASRNQLTGSLPRKLISLPSLEYLILFRNQLNGTIPSPPSNLTQLILSDNKLSGPIPSNLSGFSNMRLLDLAINLLTGTLPQSVSSLSNLETLSLQKNSFSGQVSPSVISAWTRLQVLDLGSNNFNGSIPTEIGSLTELVALAVNTNQFSGTLPTELSRLTKLGGIWELSGTGSRYASSILSMEDNKLTGSVPTELGRALTDLLYLNLTNNLLEGNMPSQIAFLTELTYLGLGSNRLRGTVPSELSRLKRLNTLELSSNSLTGTLPWSIGGLTSLRRLELANNFLTGVIPLTIANLTGLTTAHFYDNFLEGEMPLCQMEARGFGALVADCEEVDCPCCTSCCPMGNGNIPEYSLCERKSVTRENETKSPMSPAAPQPLGAPPPSPPSISPPT